MKSDQILEDTTIWVSFLRGLDPSLKNRLAAWIRTDICYHNKYINLDGRR
jgi:hypothetical protein